MSEKVFVFPKKRRGKKVSRIILSTPANASTDVVCIVGSGIPGGRYIGSSDPSSGEYNRTRSG